MNTLQSPATASVPPSPSPAQGTAAGWYRAEEAIMGTEVSVELQVASLGEAEAAIAAVMAEMHRIDATMSPHKADSELSLVNAGAAMGPVVVSPGMFGLLARAMAFSKLSGGVFDITFASAGNLYDYRAGIAPDPSALNDALPLIDWRHVQLDPATRGVRFARPGVRIDLGGFAKGHAVDNAVAILRRLGIANAMVAAGGDSHVMGSRGDRPWTVAIRDPRRQDAVVGVVPLEDCSISTSGDYERFFERDGVRCHHLLDPRTGRSPAGVRSVTIIADDGLTTEAFSKTVFVLGVADGLRFVEAHSGIDAVIVDAHGALHYSAGLLG
ncbi:MAG: FAD:protein FMN transferase [Caulobacter sp.]|nr:FAD:protein FMN transferase [Vitreoscilla sp.]